jgi:hypothetical protein
MNTIQPTLITPRANNAAISPQQQPTHQAPWASPIRSAPIRPGCQAFMRNIIGLRHLFRQAFFSGVS